MAIFGLFGKKDNQPAPAPADKNSARGKREEARTDPAQKTQRNARANATALKIDAIESEMSSEFNPTRAANSSIPGPVTQQSVPSQQAAKQPVKGAANLPTSFAATLPIGSVNTDHLLGDDDVRATAIEVSSSAAQVIEEAAIMYANAQVEVVEQMLQAAIHEDTSKNAPRISWWMLFDLYQITGNHDQFEHLSIEYASKFETSPPAWIENLQAETQAAPVRTGATPAVAFSGKLDGNIIKLLERAQKLGEGSRTLRLEFARVTEVDPVGCGLLLRILNKLHKSEHDLILVGAAELATKIRSILEVGRRDETEAPWLLLLEILRLLNRESEFEEASIDYCVTFEVSPPAFVAPKNKVTTDEEESGSVDTSSDCYTMPAVIEGKIEQLVKAITTFAAEHNPAVLDCSKLTRVDFSAAGQLLSSLAPLSAGGRAIEMQNVNYLVGTLFNVMGLKDIARIIPRKH